MPGVTFPNVRARTLLISGFITLAAATAVACGDNDDARLTGVAPVDQVIQEVQRAGAASLARRLKLIPATCHEPPTDTGAFMCPPGTPAGASVDVFTLVACHAEPLFAANAGQAVTRLLAPAQGGQQLGRLKLFAAHRATDERFGETYRLVFASPFGEGRGLWALPSGEIVLIDVGCGPQPASSFITGVTDFIVPPDNN